ncbi:MAG: aminopeptidase P family protein [Fimbriimonadaceae bacterium]|nr:aminopeptidase P family protein [Fimbriimonadaceae bacterium]
MNTPLNRLRQSLVENGVEAIVVTDPINVGWLTGFTGSFAMVFVTQSGARFITDSRYTIQAQEQVHGIEVRSFGAPRKIEDEISDVARDLNLTEVGFEPSVTFATHDRWKSIFGAVTLRPLSDLLGPLRMIKTSAEVEKIKAACRLADATMEHVSRLIQPGVREIDIALDLEFFVRRQGATCGFDPIVVAGPNSARPHGVPSEYALQPGDFVTIDLGAKLDGYNSDITRTFVVGKASDRHREVYALVLRALLECTAMLKPGIGCHDVDAHARRILDESDLAKYFGHGLGHGLGRAVHDFGRLGPGSTETVTAGQVWTVEPGVYIEGFGGLRIEDDVHVTEGVPEVLSHFPRELMEL